jgi:hypothetical protein
VENAKRALASKGLFTVNVAPDDGNSQRNIALLGWVLGSPTLVIGIRWGGNLIVFAGRCAAGPSRGDM